MQFTVDQFASANSVQKPVAYGFLRFLAEKGFASTSKATKPEGTRGKPSVVYDIPENVAQTFNLSAYVSPAPVETTATVQTSTEQPSA